MRIFWKWTMFVLLLLFSELILANSLEIVSAKQHSALVKTGPVYHQLSLQSTNGDTVIVDTLFYFHPPNSNLDYSDFLGNYQGAGDTCINWFTLLAPGKVTKLMMQNSSTGTAQWYIWTPVFNQDDSYKYPNNSGMNQLIPTDANLHYCTKLSTSHQTMDSLLWNTYDLVQEAGTDIRLDSAQLDFWVGYKLDEYGHPKIYQDVECHYPWNDGNYRSFTTLHSQGNKWYANVQSGTDNWFAHMMQVEVVYETIPPIISDLPDLCDTFLENRTIWVKVIEIEGEDFKADLVSKVGKYGNPDLQEMIYDTLDYFWADLDYSSGDTIYYYVRAEDETGMSQCSDWKSFVCVSAPSSEVHTLIIDNSTLKMSDRYIDALDFLGIDNFYWNFEQHNGIDYSVILHPDFLTMIVLDGKDMILPITDTDDQDIYKISHFLNTGGNLLLINMDYLYYWDYIGTGRFTEGDFAYDYLGIEDFTGDPDDDYNPYNGGVADTMLLSVSGNPITSDFSADSIAYGPIRYQIGDSVVLNWADYIDPSSSASAIFKGLKTENSMAICLESKYFRTATFSFPIELASEMAQFYTLLDSTLAWLNENTTRLDTVLNSIQKYNPIVESSFKILGNYPNPFNPETTIRFDIYNSEHVILKIYNLLGKQVAELVDSRLNPGSYSINWKACSETGKMLPSGIYIYQIVTSSKSATGKMVLLR